MAVCQGETENSAQCTKFQSVCAGSCAKFTNCVWMVFSVRNGRCAQTCGGNAAAHTSSFAACREVGVVGFPCSSLVMKLCCGFGRWVKVGFPALVWYWNCSTFPRRAQRTLRTGLRQRCRRKPAAKLRGREVSERRSPLL